MKFNNQHLDTDGYEADRRMHAEKDDRLMAEHEKIREDFEKDFKETQFDQMVFKIQCFEGYSAGYKAGLKAGNKELKNLLTDISALSKTFAGEYGIWI